MTKPMSQAVREIDEDLDEEDEGPTPAEAAARLAPKQDAEGKSKFSTAKKNARRFASEEKRLNNERSRFKPGHHVGRPKGSGNAINRDLRKGLIEAAVIHGYDGAGEGGLVGYCFMLAEQQQRTFGSLLAKLIPLQLSGSVGLGIASVQINAVPADKYLSAEDVAKTIEGQVVETLETAVVAEIESRETEDEDEGAEEEE